jgi:phosphoribosylglycinamide formyltransferase-1
MRIRPPNRQIGILLSGRGSNFEAIAESVATKALQAEIAIVISNVEEAPGLARARERGLNTAFIPSKGVPREAFDWDLASALNACEVGLVVLAGFMRIFSPVMLQAYPNQILNIHPSLLPAFPGKDVHQAVLESGVKFSGCTVHLVNEELDGGPIVMQATVPVMDSDTAETLAARILVQEHRIYSQAIDLILSSRCELSGRRVRVTHGFP